MKKIFMILSALICLTSAAKAETSMACGILPFNADQLNYTLFFNQAKTANCPVSLVAQFYSKKTGKTYQSYILSEVTNELNLVNTQVCVYSPSEADQAVLPDGAKIKCATSQQ